MPWPRQRTLAEVVAEYRRQALAREAKVAKRLSGLYRKLERKFKNDLERVIRKIETAHMLGLPIEQSWLAHAESISELLARLRSYIDEFSAASGQIVVGGTQSAAIDGASHAAGLAKAAGVRSGFRRLNENQLIDLFGAMEPGSPLYDLFRDLGPRAVAKARTIFGEAAVQGQNPRVVARRLSSSIQNLTETRALLIARTETNRSYRGATLRSYRANSDVVTGWRWMSARNSRTCPVCLAMDGTVHQLSEDFASHPSCRCAAVPITEYSDPPGETGEEWFAKQPEELQRKVLGPSKLDLYKTGRMKLSDLVEKTNHPRWGPGLTEASLTTLLGKMPKPTPTAPPQVPPQAPAPAPLPSQPKRQRKPRSSAPAPLPPAPAPAPTKTPVPESSKLDIRKPRSGPKKAVAQRVLDVALPYIDATFANAPTTPTRVSLVSNIRGANGDFHRGTKFIRVSLSGNFGNPYGMALTTVHEWGHHLDNSLGAKHGSTWASGPAATPQALRWLTLVQNSESFIKLQMLGSRSHAEYFRRTQECFSRCMEMMMAKRLGGEVLKALDAKRAHWASDGFTAYWEWTEFEPILEAFEDWLRAEGVLQ